MRSTKELIKELRAAPASWMDAAIVVAFENRFEFVGEDHPDPVNRLNALQEQGGLAIGVAGIKASQYTDQAFAVQVFQEFKGQAWVYEYMETLRGIVRSHTLSE